MNSPTDSTTPIKPRMVYVKGGTFTMGTNKVETPEEEIERPAHKVTVSSFWIGAYEVTVAEFRRFMNTHTYVTDAEQQGFSYSFDGKSLIYRKQHVTWQDDVFGEKRVNEEDHPVLHVSRNDAIAYCDWLSRQTGKKYRLATEAEWEYAAKGGAANDTFEFSGSDDIEEIAWYGWNSNFKSHPVGTRKPNRLGLYDMSGNAWEWCADWLGPYTTEAQTDPRGSDTGVVATVRGGGWRYNANRCRTTTRRNMERDFNGSGPGFRLASTAN